MSDQFLQLGSILIPSIKRKDIDSILEDILRILPSNNYGDPVRINTAMDVEVFILIMLLMDDELIEDLYIIDTPKNWKDHEINNAVNKVQFTRLMTKLKPKNLAILFRNIYSIEGSMDYRLKLIHYRYYNLTNNIDHNMISSMSTTKDISRLLFIGTYKSHWCDYIASWFC
jgi:hypothetical protein